MKWKEFITFRLSKFLISVIPAVLIGLFGCFTVPRCSPGVKCSAYVDIPCFLIVAGIAFCIIWTVYSVAKISKLTNKTASIISIAFLILLIIILIFIRGRI